MLTSTTAPLNRNTPLFDWYLMPEAYSAPLVTKPCTNSVSGRAKRCSTRSAAQAPPLSLQGWPGAMPLASRSTLSSALLHASRAVIPSTCPALRLEVKRLLADAHLRLDRICEDVNQQAAALLPDMPRLERWMARKVACKIVTLRECIAQNVSEENRDIPMLALASILRGASNMKLSPHAFGSREVKQDAPVLPMFEMKLAKMLVRH